MKIIFIMYVIVALFLPAICIEHNLLYIYSILMSLSIFGYLINIINVKNKLKLIYDKVPKYELWNQMDIDTINPIYAGLLLKKEKININNIISVLFMLEQKKVVSINIVGDNYYIKLNKNQQINELDFYEYIILQLFFDNSEEINLSDKLKEFRKNFEYKILLKRLYKEMEDNAKKEYFINIKKYIKDKWYDRYIGIIIIYGWAWVLTGFTTQITKLSYFNLFLYILLLAMFIYSIKTKVIKPNYYERVNKVYGLYRYLKEYSLISSKEFKYVKLYEKFYVYAISLGIAKEFEEEFKQEIVDNKLVFYTQLIFSKNNKKKPIFANYLFWWFIMMGGFLIPIIVSLLQWNSTTKQIIGVSVCGFIVISSLIFAIVKTIKIKIEEKFKEVSKKYLKFEKEN